MSLQYRQFQVRLKAYRAKKRKRMVVKIQAVGRGMVLRNNIASILREKNRQHAAKKIQAIARIYIAKEKTMRKRLHRAEHRLHYMCNAIIGDGKHNKYLIN